MVLSKSSSLLMEAHWLDLDDKGQTIKLTEAPKDTPEPSKPVKTGDETTVLPYLLLAGAALLFAAGFGILYIRKRKKDK